MTRPVFSMHEIPPGDAGAQETLVMMRQLVNEDLGNPGAVLEAQRMVAVDGDLATSIHDVIDRRFIYEDDPPFLERLQDPEQLLAQLATSGTVKGDCDDAAILVAFLGAAHGVTYKFRAVGFTAGGDLCHVYTLLQIGGEWRTFDVTRNPVQPQPPEVRALELAG